MSKSSSLRTPQPSSLVPEKVIPAIPCLVKNGSLSKDQVAIWCLANGYTYDPDQNQVTRTGIRATDGEIACNIDDMS